MSLDPNGTSHCSDLADLHLHGGATRGQGVSPLAVGPVDRVPHHRSSGVEGGKKS